MVEKALDKLLLGARTTVGKVLVIILSISLSLMTWNASSIEAAFAQGDSDTTSESSVEADGAQGGTVSEGEADLQGDDDVAGGVDENGIGDVDVDTDADPNADPLDDPMGVTTKSLADPQLTSKGANEVAAPQLNVSMEATPSLAAKGDQITYTVTVQNTGNVSLTDVTVSDSLAAISTSIGSIEAGASATVAGSYTVTSVSDAAISNTATASTTYEGQSIEATSGAVTVDTAYKVTFYDRDGEVYATANVKKGEAIGSQIPATIPREDYNAYWAEGYLDSQGSPVVSGDRIDSSYVPSGDKTIVPDYDKITYTITFYTDDSLTGVVTTKTVDVDTSYSLNDIPAVPEKSGYAGKWVYSGGAFGNNVTVTENMSVWAEYDQTIFTVNFMVGDEVYQTDTYYKGDALALPTEPVVEGKDFSGWYDGETQYEGGESVMSDLTLTATFVDQYYVNFVVLNDDGSVSEQLSQYYRSEGEAIGTMPEDPFVSGKVFQKWVNQETGEEVTAETVVDGNITAVAQFRTVEVFNITAEYYYLNDSGNEVIFNTDLIQVEASELPYTITAPASTETDENEVAGGPTYYVSTPTITVTADSFDTERKCTVRFQYVEYTAEYDFVYMLKDLEGDGYTKIDSATEHEYGVLNSTVTATVKNFDYANFESAPQVTITEASGQEVPVYYTRKNFSVSYETNGGSYIAGATVPYGTEYTVTTDEPTRTGYSFDGWYTDAALTQAAGSTVTVEGNTTLYAKWTGEEVNYTIVYMLEKYNDAGTASSFVYDNSREGTGTVGTTVTATDAPPMYRTGWEADTERNEASSVTIAADGSSVLYVYYKLTEYTFHFRPGTYGYIYVTATLNGDEKTGNNNFAYTMTVKLGQDISTTWPTSMTTGTYTTGIWRPETHTVNFYGWQGSGSNTVNVTKRLVVTEDLLPTSGTTQTYTARWLADSNTYTVNYWLQNADDDDYTRSETYSQTYQSNSGNLTPKDITGYTFVYRDDQGRTFNFYYNRDTYNIDYIYSGTSLDTIEDVKFDADITGETYNWTPTAEQCGVDDDYTFDGWYSDSGLTTKYTFSTMPASNLVLYAKWNAPTYTVSFVDNDGTTPLFDSETVEKYKKATNPGTPTKSGYVFDGWYTSVDGDTLYDWNTQITADTTVYAHWTQKTLSYTVNYVDEDGTTLATSKTVTNPNYVVGDTVTEQAVAIAGYRPMVSSQTLTLTENDSENVITFEYNQKTDVTSYTVKYILDPSEYTGGEIKVAETKTVTEVPGDTASVIEVAAAVDYDTLYAEHSELEGIQFHPDAAEKTFVLASDETENVFMFLYSSYKHVNVTVNFVDVNGDPIADADTSILKVGNTFTLSRTPIAGWELKEALVGDITSTEPAGSEYKITDETGDLTFTLVYQKKATVTVNSLTKQYDGTALTLPEELDGQVTVEGLLEGDSLTGITLGYSGADNDTNDGRINVGVATVTPSAAVISGNGENSEYYKVRYIAGTLEVTKVNVTVRIEPDRWTGAEYNGTEYKAGFTNPSKAVPDYILISNEDYETAYLDTIWETIKGLPAVHAGGHRPRVLRHQ